MLKAIEIDPFLKAYKTFMRDFYAKDIRAINPEKSIRQSRKEGAEVALGVIFASDSLGRFINSIHRNDMLRISVHAKPVHDLFNKVGIYLNEIRSNCPMPWHGVALKLPTAVDSEKFIFEKKCILEKLGCELVPDLDGKGAYYRLPKNIKYDINLSPKENLLINQGKN